MTCEVHARHDDCSLPSGNKELFGAAKVLALLSRGTRVPRADGKLLEKIGEWTWRLVGSPTSRLSNMDAACQVFCADHDERQAVHGLPQEAVP